MQPEQYMQCALELARLGRGAVEPNPPVGAVLVRDGRIIGEGYHHRFGGPHAEIEAMADAKANGQSVAGATLYVTLEPCGHKNKKTPPCTEAIIAARIAKVVAGMIDPDRNVSGKGLAALKAAGIEASAGLLEPQARALLAGYIKLRTAGRPWVICKWAQSLDGRIATYTGHSKWISGPASRMRGHQLRALCDGICVGAGTIKADDPLLTNRSGAGKQPARLVLDEKLKMPPHAHILGTTDVSPVIIATRRDSPKEAERALLAAGAQVLRFGPGKNGIDLPALLDELGKRQWTYLLVEGGRTVLSAFIGQKLADELWVFVAPRLVGGSRSLGPVQWEDPETIDQALQLPRPEVERIEDDLLLRYVLTPA